MQQKIVSYVDQIFPPEYFEEYIVKKIVGKGSYGHVAKAVKKNQQKYVAIKKMTNLFNSLPETRRILRQLVLLKNCKHENIVQMIDVIIPKNQTLQNFTQVYIITEYCDSDLQKVFKTDGNFFEIGHVRHILYQIICGIKYLHSANIIHRDLKPANVLINSKGLTIKICDFGLSRAINNDEQKDKSSQSQSQPITSQQQKKQEPKPAEQTSKSRKKGLKRMNTGTVQVKSEQQSKDQMRIKKRESMTNPNVKLTLRVTTRWYRAPEIILLDKDYNKPIDIWSVGCIFGELLKMQKCVCADSLQRFPLFPGKYCYPVSPNTLGVVYKSMKQSDSVDGYPQGRNDQLFMILSAIGKPTQQQMSFLTDEKAKQYIRKLETVQRKTFQQMFPKVQKQAIQLLKSTLMFNPSERIPVDDILRHKFFETVRNPAMERQREPIIMNPQIQDEQLTLDQLRKCFVKQLSEYL